MATPNMGMILPTEDGSADVWDTILNTALTLNDAHDHTSGKGVAIPSAALNINADVSWASGGTNYAITALKAVDFTAVTAASVAGYAGAFFVNSSDSELYFRSIAGTNIKITSGTTLNVSIVGGIGGDYSSVSALLDYDDASDTYRFRQETSAAVRQYAKIASADLVLREYKAAGNAVVPVNAVTLKSPAALAASYTVTLPDAVPASTVLVQTTSAGVLTFTNTIVNDMTMAANKSVIVSGTGKYKHATKTITVPCLPTSATVSAGTVSGTGGTPRSDIAISTTAYFPLLISLNSDALVYSITLEFTAAVGAGAVARLYAATALGGFGYLSVTQAGSGLSTITLDCSGSPVSVGSLTLWVRVVTDGATTCSLGDCIVSYQVI